MQDDIGSVHRRWQNRTLVRERDKREGRWLWGIVLCIALALLPAGAYQIAKNECVKLTYDLDHLRSRNETLVEQERRLRVDRARLESLPAIEAWATGQQRLVRADGERTLVVHRDAASDRFIVLGPAPGR